MSTILRKFSSASVVLHTYIGQLMGGGGREVGRNESGEGEGSNR